MHTEKNLFFNINYADPRIESSVKIVMHILNDTIITTNKTIPYNITVVIEEDMDPKTYGMASWATRMIWLDSNNFGRTNELNDITTALGYEIIFRDIK